MEPRTVKNPPIVETDIPARLDRLPWSRFHTLVVAALGITWILDGLEVTLAGSVAGALKASPVLQFSNADVGLAASAYLAGAVLGALFFGGHMPSTDNLPYAWWDSPNIHFCTIKDFVVLCDVTGAKMERAVAFNAWGTPLRFNAPWWFWNLFGEQAVFLLSRRG